VYLIKWPVSVYGLYNANFYLLISVCTCSIFSVTAFRELSLCPHFPFTVGLIMSTDALQLCVYEMNPQWRIEFWLCLPGPAVSGTRCRPACAQLPRATILTNSRALRERWKFLRCTDRFRLWCARARDRGTGTRYSALASWHSGYRSIKLPLVLVFYVLLDEWQKLSSAFWKHWGKCAHVYLFILNRGARRTVLNMTYIIMSDSLL